HSNATNARRRKPLIGAVRSIGARLTGFRSKAALIRIQREQAEAAADKIGRFIKEIESQLGWTTQMAQAASTPEQLQFDASRLLRQVPAITELVQLDASGHEQLRV